MLENWKTMEHESDGDTNCNWHTRYSHQSIDKKSGGHGNKRASGDHPKDNSKIGLNTEKGPGDFWRLAVNLTPVEDDQLTLVWITLRGVK